MNTALIVLFLSGAVVSAQERDLHVPEDHPLYRIAEEADTHIIPRKIINYVVQRPNIRVVFHSFEGETTASYVPSENKLKLTSASKDSQGRADPRLIENPAQLMEDAFHESFHAWWDDQNFETRRPYWVRDLIPAVQASAKLTRPPLTLTEAQAIEVIEEGIGGKFGKIINTAYSGPEQAIVVALRKARLKPEDDDNPAVSPEEAGFRYAGRIPGQIQSVVEGPTMGYCSDFEDKNIAFDLTPEAREFIEFNLLGAAFSALAGRAQGRAREAVRMALQREAARAAGQKK